MAGEQLAFELKRGLFGREKDQWCAFGIVPQRGANFGEAAECLAAAGGAEEKSHLHTAFFAQRRDGAKEFIRRCAAIFFVSFQEDLIIIFTTANLKAKTYATNTYTGPFCESVEGQIRHRRLFLFASLDDGLNELHVVDVERADGVFAFQRFRKKVPCVC